MTQQLPEGFVLESTQPTTGSDLPEGFVLETKAAPREDAPKETAEQGGFFQSFSDWWEGAGRDTPDLQRMPTIMDGGFLRGENVVDVAQVAMMTMLTNDQNELANIIQKQIPNVKVTYNKDAEGNIYPILHNQYGESAAIDKPGVDLLNLGQFFGQASVFSIGGGTSGVIRTAAMEGGRELAIQSAQSATGGDVDAGDVVAAATLGGGFESVSNLFGMAYRTMKGGAKPEVEGLVASAKEYNVPLYTSDIYNPDTWFTRGAQYFTESLPIVGTGGLRTAQQKAREQAVKDFQSMYQGGTYDEIFHELGKQTKANKKIAGDVYNKIDPFLEQQSRDVGGIPMPKGMAKLDELIEVASNPNLDTSPAMVNILDDIDSYINKDLSYKELKSNLGAWQQKLDSLDAAGRSQFASREKAQLEGLLGALRDDRNAFAKGQLSDQDYSELMNANVLYGEVANTLQRTKIKNILDKGDINPELARQMLYSTNASDVRILYDNLTPEGHAAARAAIISDIAKDLKKSAGGDEFNPNQFISGLRKRDSATSVFWKGREDELDGFVRLMDATRRAQAVAKGAGSQTAERQLVAGGIGVGAGASGYVPISVIAGYASIGGIARAIESPRFRNMLVRYNGLEPQSMLAQRMGQQLVNYLEAMAQADPAKGQGEVSQEISREASQMMGSVTQ